MRKANLQWNLRHRSQSTLMQLNVVYTLPLWHFKMWCMRWDLHTFGQALYVVLGKIHDWTLTNLTRSRKGMIRQGQDANEVNLCRLEPTQDRRAETFPCRNQHGCCTSTLWIRSTGLFGHLAAGSTVTQSRTGLEQRRGRISRRLAVDSSSHQAAYCSWNCVSFSWE